MLPENEHEDYSQYSENSHSNLTKSRLDPACPCVFLFFEGTNKQLQRKDRGCPASFCLKVLLLLLFVRGEDKESLNVPLLFSSLFRGEDKSNP
jgi:hypothetical protein